MCKSPQEQPLEGGFAFPDRKKAVEKGVVESSLAFCNRLSLLSKPNNKWRPILDLSTLNLYLRTETFKIETPETIRLSLQQGEWVTSLDFSPFIQATALLEFTKVIKEVKLAPQARGIRSHQYLVAQPCMLGNLPTTYPDSLRPYAKTWMVKLSKLELIPLQVFNFVGYFDLFQGLVKPTKKCPLKPRLIR